MHPNAQQVAARLTDLGVAGEVRVLAEAAPTAATAAAQLNCVVGAIANSLIFTVSHSDSDDPTPLLVLTSGAHRVDTTRIATLLAEHTDGHGIATLPRVRQATPEFVRTHTGQPIGGVAPVGHPVPVPTFVDTWLKEHEVVWAAGGHPHTVFPTTFAELLRITEASVADVGAD